MKVSLAAYTIRRSACCAAPWLLAVCLLVSCSRISVKTEFDHNRDFSVYKTYGWTGQTNQQARKEALAEGLRGMVLAEIDRRMRELGYRLVVDAEPDLVLSRRGRLKQGLVQSASGAGVSTGIPRGDPDYDRVGAEEYSETYSRGNLMLQAVESSSGQRVWMGRVQGIIDPLRPVEQEIRTFVGRLMQQFPPASTAG